MRNSFTRHLTGTVAAVLLACGLSACPEEKSLPAPPPSSDHTKPPAPHAIQDSVKPAPSDLDAGSGVGTGAGTGTGPDAGAATGTSPGANAGAADAGPHVPGALEKALSNFAGFNKNESRFAFSTYSEGAGAYILQIVVGQQGSPSQRWVLDSEASAQKAKAALDADGFTSAQGALPPGTSVDVTVDDGKMKVMVHTAEGENRPAYDGNPFLLGGGGAKVAKAVLDRISPSGTVAAIRVDSISMGEFGGATTYVLVRVATPK